MVKVLMILVKDSLPLIVKSEISVEMFIKIPFGSIIPISIKVTVIVSPLKTVINIKKIDESHNTSNGQGKPL